MLVRSYDTSLSIRSYPVYNFVVDRTPAGPVVLPVLIKGGFYPPSLAARVYIIYTLARVYRYIIYTLALPVLYVRTGIYFRIYVVRLAKFANPYRYLGVKVELYIIVQSYVERS